MNILIINPYGIGDVLFTFPLIENIKINYPDFYVGYLCNKRVESILKYQKNIDECFVYEKDDWRNLWQDNKFKCIREFRKFLKDIKRHKFDICFDFSLAPEFGFFSLFLGIKKRIGYQYKRRGIFLNEKIKLDGYSLKHVVLYYLDLLKFLDIKPSFYKLKLNLSNEVSIWAENIFRKLKGKKGLIIAVIPGGGASWGKDRFRKQWGFDKFAKLIGLIKDKIKAGIIILGDKKDTQDFAGFYKRDEDIIDFMGKTNILEFAGLISKCDLVICNDGGPLHIAVALGIPTLSIFGPVDPVVYGPFPQSNIHKVVTLGIPCQPCYYKFKVPECKSLSCLKDLSVNYVFEELRAHLITILSKV
jgi:lipopolysaccharide heptosyltransferase II